MLTDKEMQSLRKMGNEAEAAVEEIVRLRAALRQIASTKGYGRDGPSSGSWVHWVSQAKSALDA